MQNPFIIFFPPPSFVFVLFFSTFQFVKIVAGWFIKGTTQSLCAAFEINKRFRCLLLCDSLFKRQTNRSVYFPIFARHSLKCDIFLAKRMWPRFVWALLCTSLQLVRQIRLKRLSIYVFLSTCQDISIQFWVNFPSYDNVSDPFQTDTDTLESARLTSICNTSGMVFSKCPSEKVHRQTAAAGGSDCEQHFGNKDSYFQYLQYELLGVLTYRPLVVLNAASIASFFIIAAHQLLRAASLFHVMNKNNHDVQVHLLQTQEGIYTVLDTCTIYWTTFVSLL